MVDVRLIGFIIVVVLLSAGALVFLNQSKPLVPPSQQCSQGTFYEPESGACLTPAQVCQKQGQVLNAETGTCVDVTCESRINVAGSCAPLIGKSCCGQLSCSAVAFSTNLYSCQPVNPNQVSPDQCTSIGRVYDTLNHVCVPLGSTCTTTYGNAGYYDSHGFCTAQGLSSGTGNEPRLPYGTVCTPINELVNALGSAQCSVGLHCGFVTAWQGNWLDNGFKCVP